MPSGLGTRSILDIRGSFLTPNTQSLDALADNFVHPAFELPHHPKYLESVVGWYRAESLGLADNTAIGTWRDEGIFGNHATQAGAARPTLQTDAGPNGYPRVNFVAASSQYFIADGWAPTVSGTDKTWGAVMVIKPTTVNTNVAIVGAGSTTTSATNAFGHAATGAVRRHKVDDAGASGNANGAAILSATAWTIVSFREATNCMGTQTDASGQAAFGADVGATTVQEGRIGALVQSGAESSFYNGDIAELIIFNRTILAEERREFAVYLARKYAINLTA